MSSVSQIIPNFIGGINDQPDELKKPGQVRDAVNVIPDVVKGLYKRPGYEKVNDEPFDVGNGTWFHMYTEEPEGRFVVFIGQSNGGVQIFNADTGERMEVGLVGKSIDLSQEIYRSDIVGAPEKIEYFKHEPEEHLRYTTKNDTLFSLISHLYILLCFMLHSISLHL